MTDPRIQRWWNRFVLWAVPARIIAMAAVVAGLGLLSFPGDYSNPAYRVMFQHATPRQFGLMWLALGAVLLYRVSAWSIAFLGSALIGWGLGFAASAWTEPRSGSRFGWVWFVAFGMLCLRQLAHRGADWIRSDGPRG